LRVCIRIEDHFSHGDEAAFLAKRLLTQAQRCFAIGLPLTGVRASARVIEIELVAIAKCNIIDNLWASVRAGLP
jgi:hypothetical protein